MRDAKRPRRLEHLTADDVAPLEALFDRRYPERLREIATIMFMVLVDRGVQAEQAPQLAIALTEGLSSELGGRGFYMHKGHAYRLRKELDNRDLQIKSEFRGWNTAVLARKYGLTEMRIRQIVGESEEDKAAARQRREAFERAQDNLFDTDTTGA